MTLFELEAIGGPLARRLARRRFEVAWDELAAFAEAPEAEAARVVWTQSAFSEYASAAAFAHIASGLLAIGAPIDLTAAAGDFVVDELVHAELSAKVAMALGGGVPLEVDLGRLVRPPQQAAPLLRVAEAIVRTSCVGESLTVAILRASRDAARPSVLGEVIERIARDEAEHAELGWTFLDWADARLSEGDRAHLGRVASAAVESFTPLFSDACSRHDALGVLSCATFDPLFETALARRVVTPLAERGIEVTRSAQGAAPEGPLAR
jgi:hypothetical protein